VKQLQKSFSGPVEEAEPKRRRSLVRGFCQCAADWVATTGQGEVRLIVPATHVQCRPLLAGGGSKLDVFSSYIAAGAHVALLPNARCIGNEGAVVTSDGHLLISTIHRFPKPVSASAAWEHRVNPGEELEFDGVLGVMVHHGTCSFAHVLADGLPRIWLVREAVNEPDAWIVPAHLPSWFSELLDMVGIPAKRQLRVESNSTVRARCLVVPDGTGFALSVAPWARTALVDLLGLTDDHPDGHRRIWISRELAGRRRWLQEGEARSALEKRGFLICQFDGQPIDWQLKLALGSDVIAGPHGAGLSWGLVARQPRGLLFEVADSILVHNDYRAVAAVVGWDYARTSHANVPVSEGDNFLCDLDIGLGEVIETLDLALDRWINQV